MSRIKVYHLALGLLLSTYVNTGLLAEAAAWPALGPAVDVGHELLELDTNFEPSGLVYHEGRGSFIGVSDEGQIAELGSDGEVLHLWSLGAAYDLEDVTVINQLGDTIFVADENTSQALEFNLVTGKLTGISSDFSSQITEIDGNGLEGLTWVPDGYHEYGPTPDGGVFLAGWQQDGDIYVFKTNFKLATTEFIEELHLTSGYTDLSALAFEPGSGHVFVVYDALNLVEERTVAGDLNMSYSLPNSDQEGFALKRISDTTVEVWLAEDTGTVWAYSDFVLNGVMAETEVFADELKIREINADGIDNDFDGLVDEANTVLENGLHPSYPALDPLITSGLISAATATINGSVKITYVDGLVYEYPVFPSGTAKLKLNFGSSYVSAKYAGQTLFLNALNGDVFTLAELGL